MNRLHAEIVTAEHATPARWAFVLHGIFGAGKNWLSFTRKLAAARPDWGFILPDLRGHGRSHGFAGPHDLEATAADLRELAVSLDLGRVEAAIGHSFGGKVALVLGRTMPFGQLWVLDSNPGTRADSANSQTMRVLEMLEGMHERFATRAEFTRAVEARGFTSAIAAWLSMSLRPADGGYEIGLELPLVRALLEDFCRVDAWAELARPTRVTQLVVAGKSFVWNDDDHRAIAVLAGTNPALTVHTYPNAGHWVHVDAYKELLALFTARL